MTTPHNKSYHNQRKQMKDQRPLSGFMRLNAACPRKVLEQAMAQLKAAVDAL